MQQSFDGFVVVQLYDPVLNTAAVQSYMTINDNVWHHVAFTVNRFSQLITLFVDGVVQH